MESGPSNDPKLHRALGAGSEGGPFTGGILCRKDMAEATGLRRGSHGQTVEGKRYQVAVAVADEPSELHDQNSDAGDAAEGF